MSDEKPNHLLILGVRHPDRRVPSLVDEKVDGDVDRFFHESPEGNSSKIKYSAWTVVKNPLAVIFGILRLAAFVVGNLAFAAKMVASGKANQLTLKSGGRTQCLQAAKQLSDKHGVEWEAVDVSLIERAKLVPLHLTLMSWLAVIFLLVSVILAFSGSIPWMIAALGSVAFATTIGTRLGDVRRPIRDERMFENIVSACEKHDCSQVVLITGENHVQGVASNAAHLNVEYDTFWLSSTADIEN
uniref:hypothetical protein n=1 Tax=Haloprofundus sp. MHR1 TaxID=2572921 RepID=UPI001F4464BB|nr:hypothetical protein [Haloprofundus sp. MHR1]